MSQSIIIEVVSDYEPLGEHNKAMHKEALELLAQEIVTYAESQAKKRVYGTVDVHVLVEGDRE